jgi:hypothetical protein
MSSEQELIDDLVELQEDRAPGWDMKVHARLLRYASAQGLVAQYGNRSHAIDAYIAQIKKWVGAAEQIEDIKKVTGWK